MKYHLLATLCVFAACSCNPEPQTPVQPEIKLVEPYKSIVSRMSTDPAADHFIYFADQHTEWDKDYAAHSVIDGILTYIPTKYVVFGGDYVMTTSKCQTKEHVDKSIERFKESVDVTKNHNAAFYVVRGNHEITTGTTSADYKGWTYSQKYVYKQIMGWAKGGNFTEMGNGTCNYYFENETARIRYIVLDPYSSDDENKEVRYGIKMEHNADATAWCKECLESLPAGWYAVILVHQGLNKCTGISDYGNMKNVLALVNANTDKVKLVLHGHVHKDVETFENGVLHVTTTSANNWQALPGIFGKVGRTYGEYSETAVDLCDLDFAGGVVKFFRFGGGYSRYININPIKVKVGESVTITPSLPYVKTWMSYDADSITAPEWTNWDSTATWTNNRSSLEGTTITGVAPGEVVVVATDERSIAREYFYVVVE